MLKLMVAIHFAFTFLGLLSSVTSEEEFLANSFGYDSLPFLLSTLKEKCAEQLDSAFCQYQNGLRNDPELSKTFTIKENKELALENESTGKEIPKENSAEEISIEIPIDSENSLHKRFTVFRRKNPTARGYKRGPGFRSWGGKRDSAFLGQNLKKRSKFASWGGKRGGEFSPDDLITEDRNAPDKRPKFQNWGGKRNIDDFSEETIKPNGPAEKRGTIWKNMRFYLTEPFKKHVPKRPQFQSWGGKRALHLWPDFLGIFQQKPRLLLNGGEKRKFSSWGGKRHDENVNQFREFHSEGNSNSRALSNLGGEKGTPDVNTSQDIGNEPKEKTKNSNGELNKNWNSEELHSDFDSWGENQKMAGSDGR